MRTTFKYIVAAIACMLVKPMAAQLPNTDIWLLDVNATKDTIILSNPVNITNRAGYDNQPTFSPDGNSILYTSIRDEKQSDIYSYNLKTKITTQFENTPTTSEYSPQFTPDGKNISVVMVEPDSTQRLWQFPLKGGAPQLVMDKVDSVGYYCWLDNAHAALFLITKPFQLVFTDVATQHSTIIMQDTVARTLKTTPNNNFYYAYKGIIHTINSAQPSKKTAPDFVMKYINEDFAVLDPYTLIMGNKAQLYVGRYTFNYEIKTDERAWQQVADLSTLAIKNITRIAISPDGKKMAIVAE